MLLFLCLPIAVVVPMSFSSASSAIPAARLSLRWYGPSSATCAARAAGTSALVALASSVAALVLAASPPTAWCAGPFAAVRCSRATSSRLILPPVITAVALYIFFAQIGLLGTISG